MMKFDRGYVVLAMLVGVTVVVASFIADESSREERTESVAAIHASQERHRLLVELQMAVTDAESAQRGFMLTRDDEYLEPYRESKAIVQGLINELLAAYKDAGPTMSQNAMDLTAVILTKFAEIDSTLVVFERNRTQSMTMKTLTFGQRSMTGVRHAAREMRVQERTFVVSQTEQWLEELQLSRTISAGGAALNLILIFVAGALVMRDMRRRSAIAADLESQVAKSTSELSELSTYLQRLSERERSSLARELHDELGGLLISIKMDLSQLKSQIDLSKDEVRTRWERVQSTLSAGIDLKRRVIEQLRPSLLDNMGLVTALKWQAEQICSAAKLRLNENFPEDEPKIAPDAAIALFRIAQEALTNIVKHAQATQVDIELSVRDDFLVLRIDDDGVGITATRPAVGSHGISGMKHRLKSYDGSFTIERRWPNGTRLVASVPLARVAISA